MLSLYADSSECLRREKRLSSETSCYSFGLTNEVVLAYGPNTRPSEDPLMAPHERRTP